MRYTDTFRLSIIMLMATVIPARAEVNVVASIKPVHALVASVMKGVGEPGIIVDGGGSPHTFAMKPSQAAMLEKADVVFWIGPQIESFLSKPLEAIASKAKSVDLIDTTGLVKLKLREGGAFEAHAHDDHDDHDHAEGKHDDDHSKKEAGHAGKDHDDHDTEKKADKDHDHGHGHEEFDAHVWLDPVNGKALVQEIAKVLSEADPTNQARYKENAAATVARIDALSAQLASELKPIDDKGFIVFHDAYQYFEKRFGLRAAGSITVSPEVVPGAKRVKELRTKVRETGVACVFAEPQFEPKLVATVIEGTSAKSGVLDPLGAELQSGPELYFKLISTMAAAFKSCLSKSN